MIHQAGPLERGVQRCLRCGAILGGGHYAQWYVGASVQVIPVGGLRRELMQVGHPPDCPESVEHLASNGTPIDGYPRQQA